jgi:hypothetical protein
VRYYFQAILVTSNPVIAGAVWMTRGRRYDVAALCAKIDVALEQPSAIANLFAVWVTVVEVAPSPASRDFEGRRRKLASPKNRIAWRIAVDHDEP